MFIKLPLQFKSLSIVRFIIGRNNDKPFREFSVSIKIQRYQYIHKGMTTNNNYYYDSQSGGDVIEAYVVTPTAPPTRPKLSNADRQSSVFRFQNEGNC